MNINNLKIALVHDFLIQYGGAERVLESFCEIFPNAPIYTLLYDKEKMGDRFKGRDIKNSFLRRMPAFLRKRHKYLLPFLPVAPETFDLREYDLVISSCGAWSKGLVTRLDTTHVCYMHSPMRFAWDENEIYLGQQKKTRSINFFSRILLNYIRMWDKVSSQRPDYMISNSKYTQARIKKYYGRESTVIYPPATICHSERSVSGVEESNNESRSLDYARDDNEKKDYFLIVSRLSPYKKIDMAIEAFNKMELPLWIIGEGQQEKYLKSLAKKNIKFLGKVPDKDLGKYYSQARALIFPGLDDFGLTMVETMKNGTPVLALGEGGAKEIVQEGKTGEFFHGSIPEVIADCVRRFIQNEGRYNGDEIKKSSDRFGADIFKREILSFIEKI